MGDIRFQEHEIKLKEEPKIPKRKYQVLLKIKNQARGFLHDLEKKNNIERAFKLYFSRFLIKKKNEDLHLFVDHKSLNKCTIAEKFQIPKINDHLMRLQG